jgi:hypothetical protein
MWQIEMKIFPSVGRVYHCLPIAFIGKQLERNRLIGGTGRRDGGWLAARSIVWCGAT